MRLVKKLLFSSNSLAELFIGQFNKPITFKVIKGVRVCLHGGGGPQVGEVTCLAVVEKWPAFTCKLTTPGVPG